MNNSKKCRNIIEILLETDDYAMLRDKITNIHEKRVFTIFFLLITSSVFSQHTFSIVAVDTITGEIGSAGATCGDSIIWPGTPGAYIISDILPGVGAIHTQSFWLASNQVNARVQMQQGSTPNQIISWLVAHDVQNNPQSRQ